MKSKWISLFACVAVTASIGMSLSIEAQTFTVIHTFIGTDGGDPSNGVVMDAAGNLYGETTTGGIGCNGYGCGTVFKLKLSTGQLTTLYRFSGADGMEPLGPPLIGPGGILYGTAAAGGMGSCDGGCGIVFSMQPPATPPRNVLSNHWTENILYTFHGSDGAGPKGNLALDRSGNIYGATGGDGTGTSSTVFELTHSNGSWSESTLHTFNSQTEGIPESGVTLDAAGNVYGATDAISNAVVYQLLAGSDWAENVLYRFTGEGSWSGVTFDPSGNLYGTESGNDSPDGGSAFELASGSWAYQLLASFTGSGGCGPHGNLLLDQAGNFYGTTFCDGAHGEGSVFKLIFSNGSWTSTTLHDFTGGNDGSGPEGSLALDAMGNLYGTAGGGGQYNHGVVWEISPTSGLSPDSPVSTTGDKPLLPKENLYPSLNEHCDVRFTNGEWILTGLCVNNVGGYCFASTHRCPSGLKAAQHQPTGCIAGLHSFYIDPMWPC